ncbi:plasmid mobilization protein [Lentzea flaviverrucosa]|uniref:plasmid mobilization protein n=1 Tax=Lentzea flaviverrucosa TaxID=200379 RepID=UPI0034E95354
MISVRLSPEEAALVRTAAEERGLSVSAFLREAALVQAHSPEHTPATPTTTHSPWVSWQVALVKPAVTILSGPGNVDPTLLGDTHELTGCG